MDIIINSPSNPVFLTIFGYPIRYYGIILSFAILVGIFLSTYFTKMKYDIKTLEIFEDSIAPAIIFSIIGARFFYVIAMFDYYLDNPSEIIMINHGGISIWGAVVFGVLTIFIYSKIKKTSFLKLTDLYALVFPLCQAIGRFGNYFNQEAYGKPTNGMIKLIIDEAHRHPDFADIKYYHPTFLYESILDLIIFFILFILYKKAKFIKNGTFFSLYLILYATARLIVENLRIDSVLNINNIPIASILSILSIIAGIIILIYIYHPYKNFNKD